MCIAQPFGIHHIQTAERSGITDLKKRQATVCLSPADQESAVFRRRRVVIFCNQYAFPRRVNDNNGTAVRILPVQFPAIHRQQSVQIDLRTFRHSRQLIQNFRRPPVKDMLHFKQHGFRPLYGKQIHIMPDFLPCLFPILPPHLMRGAGTFNNFQRFLIHGRTPCLLPIRYSEAA